MATFGYILAYLGVVAEGAIVAFKYFGQAWEIWVFIGLSCVAGFAAVGFIDEGYSIPAKIGRYILSLIFIPVVIIMLLCMVELVIWLVQTFTLKGVIGIGFLIAIAVAIFSSCIFIFFF